MVQQIPGGAVDLSAIVQQAQSKVPGGQGAVPGESANAVASTAAGAQGAVVDVPSVVLEANDDTFEQLMQLSSVVPVVVVIGATNCAPCDELEPILERITVQLGGRTMMAKVNADTSPGLRQAFQVQQLPTVVAVIGGQAVPMFQGVQPEEQLRELFGQLLTLSAQQGVVGRVNAPDLGDEPSVTPEPQVNPDHLPAIEALERGDYAAAVAEYERVLVRAPRDSEAQAALAQVQLLHRLEGADSASIRAEAAALPQNVEAQLSVADLDISGGHIEDAFLRLLELFPSVEGSDREAIRTRLLDYFEVVGQQDPRVQAARSTLTNLLFS